MNYFAIPGIEFEKGNVRSDLIIEKVCEAYEYETGFAVSTQDVRGRTRKAQVVDARSISAYLIESAYSLGCTEVGKLLNRDHASVLHYWGRTRDYMNYDPLTKKVMETAKSYLTPYKINWKHVPFGKMKVQ